jgi:SET domain-containing protein
MQSVPGSLSTAPNRSVEIRPSPLSGVGTFAVEFIPRGMVVHTLSGELLTEAELDARIRQGTERMDDSFRIGADAFLDLDHPSLSINHSCDPTTGVRGNGELFALGDIAPGEEITYDYSTTVAPLPGAAESPYPETEWQMVECRCGTPRCRGTVGDVLTIPQADLRRYQELGALPDLVAAFLEQHATAPSR